MLRLKKNLNNILRGWHKNSNLPGLIKITCKNCGCINLCDPFNSILYLHCKWCYTPFVSRQLIDKLMQE